MNSLLDATTRIAFSAFIHDLGKFAERGRLEVSQELIDKNRHQFCPVNQFGQQTHIHAAYTALALDGIEVNLPDIKSGDQFPFVSDSDDSIIGAAARHHRPESFLQWVIAQADRLASGFDRQSFDQYNTDVDSGFNDSKLSHYRSRLLSLFDAIQLSDASSVQKNQYAYRLLPLSPEAIFPVSIKKAIPDNNESAIKEYKILWEGFCEALENIPSRHKNNLTLWLDHFDSLFMTFAQAIPAATNKQVRPDVSLYDHAKTTAAMAAAIWRYHHERNETSSEHISLLRNNWDGEQQADNKFLLIQGDLFGIQDFIFSVGDDTGRHAAKLLRGRSAYVSLISELAALKVLDALQLPGTSQIINAAGKFLIVAPNTEQTMVQLQQVKAELDRWFVDNTFAIAGIGLAWTPCSAKEFLAKENGQSLFSYVISKLFMALDTNKYQRQNLCGDNSVLLFSDYRNQAAKHGLCKLDGRSPARNINPQYGLMSSDQVLLGAQLARPDIDTFVISRKPVKLEGKCLELPIFGYHVSLCAQKQLSSLDVNDIVRCWDFSLPQEENTVLWSGLARRNINSYVPVCTNEKSSDPKYRKLDEDDMDSFHPGQIKTLHILACEDIRSDVNKGVAALMTLKGDIDNLGAIFEAGLKNITFARMASLSRQVNNYFSLYLPWLCRNKFRNMYTVFAGGDDFFLLGPWSQTQEFTQYIRNRFGEYVCNNPDLHISAGLYMSHSKVPIRHLAAQGEQSLERAKHFNNGEKNALCLHGVVVSWNKVDQLFAWQQQLSNTVDRLQLSTGFVYGLLELMSMRDDSQSRPEATIWRSRLVYRSWRWLNDNRQRLNLNKDQVKTLHDELMKLLINDGMEQLEKAASIPVTNILYRNRRTRG